MKKLYLASQSPRRKQLLEQIGLSPIVIPSSYEEGRVKQQGPVDMVLQHARGKAQSTSVREGIILAADTIVVLDNVVLGKPQDSQEAMKMLRELSGRVHYVYTGFCLLDRSTGDRVQDYEQTAVTFRTLSACEIRRYVVSKEPFDKAGAYGIQGRAAIFVQAIAGCYFNVVGLPLPKVAQTLQQMGLDISLLW